MGACSSDESYQTRFKNKYQFISQVHDHNFGQIKVYRKKQLNYDYVMILYKYIQTSQLNKVASQIQALHASFLKQNQPMALRIFNFDIDDNQISNCSLSLVKIYVEYFNFTLHDLIDVHKMKNDAFSYEELRYILNCCVLAFRQFVDLTQKRINVSSKCIYLTPEGVLKFCPIRFQEFYQHSTPVCNAICNQTNYKQVTSLERGQKYLTAQVKKIFNEISELNFSQDPDVQKIIALLQQVKRTHSIESILPKIGLSKIEALHISKAQFLKSENTNNEVKNSTATNKPISSTSNFSQKVKNNENQNVKLSLTKCVKNNKSFQKN